MAKLFELLSFAGKVIPGRSVTQSEGRRLVRNGEAQWCDNRRCLQLVPVLRGPRPGLSTNPTTSLMERYATAGDSARDHEAVSAIDAWAK